MVLISNKVELQVTSTTFSRLAKAIRKIFSRRQGVVINLFRSFTIRKLPNKLTTTTQYSGK